MLICLFSLEITYLVSCHFPWESTRMYSNITRSRHIARTAISTTSIMEVIIKSQKGGIKTIQDGYTYIKKYARTTVRQYGKSLTAWTKINPWSPLPHPMIKTCQSRTDGTQSPCLINYASFV